MRGRPGIWIGIAAAVMAWGQAPAAAGGKQTHPATFSGRCDFSGLVRFRPGLSATPRTVAQSVKAPGTCSGSFRDRHGFTHALSGAQVVFSETSSGRNVSCAFGNPTGSGSLRFHWGTLRFAFAERRAGAAVTGTATGARGGAATGYGAPSTSENPVSAVEECGGAGIRQVRVDLHVITTPDISG